MKQHLLTILITAVVAVQSLCTGLTVCMDGGACHQTTPVATTAAPTCCCGHHGCSPTPEDTRPTTRPDSHDDCDCTDIVFGQLVLTASGHRSLELPPMLPLTTIDLVDLVARHSVDTPTVTVATRAGPPPSAALSLRAEHLRPVRLLL